ncbi:MAG: serine hydrolase [Pseudonocardia sp.]
MPNATTTDDLAELVGAALDAGDAEASVHVREVGGEEGFALEADRPVVSASTFKILVLLEFACQVAEGRLSASTRIRVTPADHTLGPTGLSVVQDDVEMSARDLAMLMMQISDNTATDVVQRLVGTEAVARRVAGLGLTATVVEGDCRELLAMVAEELGVDLGTDVYALTDEDLAAAVATSPSLQAQRGNRTTAREMTTLLDLIWRDAAGPAEACAQVRRVMGLQHAPHRLSTAYGDGPVISAKTGTLVGGIRNEVGVFDFGGGERYAVAVFLRAGRLGMRNPVADRAIGDVARIVLDRMRATT